MKKRVDAKSFDFEGVKYKRQEAPAIITKLEAEIKSLQQSQEQLDKDAVLYFLSRAGQTSSADAALLKEKYISYFELRKKADAFLQGMNTMLETLAPVFSGQTLPVEEIRSLISRLKKDHENKFKQELQEWTSRGVFAHNPELTEKISAFISSDYAYFGDTSFFENELRELHSLCNESWAGLSNYSFLQFKNILETQLPYAA
jgi:hypothetical protein